MLTLQAPLSLILAGMINSDVARMSRDLPAAWKASHTSFPLEEYALMPELVFNVAYSSKGKEVWLAFQAAGKSLDIRATSVVWLRSSSYSTVRLAGLKRPSLRAVDQIWCASWPPLLPKSMSTMIPHRKPSSMLFTLYSSGPFKLLGHVPSNLNGPEL
jgi:hypothetical protein